MQRVHQLPIDVELKLAVGAVADPNRLGAEIARQPRDFPFAEAPFTRYAIHDLALLRAARDRAQQPLAPSMRLVIITRVHEREQRQGGVTQPTIAVIPVAR